MYHAFLVFRATHDKLIQVFVILANWVQQQFCILVNSADANRVGLRSPSYDGPFWSQCTEFGERNLCFWKFLSECSVKLLQIANKKSLLDMIVSTNARIVFHP